MNNFYVYFHINPVKNSIFYVGKGKDDRAYDKTGRNRHWTNTVNKYGFIIDIAHDNLTESDAFDLEAFYIKKIGRRDLGTGILVNLTDGYEGHSNPSEEARIKIGQVHKGPKSQEVKDKISTSLMGNIPWNKGLVFKTDEEQKEKKRLYSKKRYIELKKKNK